MITIVATWRCKCGVSVKVVAEADEQKPTSTVVATCPDCGDKQTVHAYRIISVTNDKGEDVLR
jgi:hypothetical protein